MSLHNNFISLALFELSVDIKSEKITLSTSVIYKFIKHKNFTIKL